jgi:hypothetical protein
MDEIDQPSRPPWSRFLTLLLSLVVLAAILATLLGIVLSQTQGASGPQRGWMVRFALLCTAFLGLILVAAFWLVMRFIRSRLPSPPPPGRTQHVDAWRIAGERMQVEEEPDEEEEEQKEP